MKIIRSRQVESILEIGPGTGEMSQRILINAGIMDYLAVERRPMFASLVRKRGLPCICCEFPPPSPIIVNESYQMVLACHSVEHTNSKLEEFVFGAEALLVPGGALLVVTYLNEDDDDWKRLIKEIGWDDRDIWNRLFFRQLKDQMHKVGEVTTETVNSYVMTSTLRDMVEALSFVASNGDETKKTEFYKSQKKLNSILHGYLNPGGDYSFPFRHHFLLVERSR